MCPNEPPIKIDVLRVFGKSLILVFGGLGLVTVGIIMGTIGLEMLWAALS